MVYNKGVWVTISRTFHNVWSTIKVYGLQLISIEANVRCTTKELVKHKVGVDPA